MRELPEISQWVWDEKYRLKRPDGTIVDKTVDDTFRRVANALAEPEKLGERKLWAERFFAAMRDFEFLPAGRIIAGAGSGRDVTLMNCYVMGTIEDSLSGIMDAVKEAALTLKTGGGIGMDFSTLRPRGAPVRGVESVSSGAVSFMEQWNAMCGTIMSAGSRRGAMMGVLRCDHPDLEEFIEAKTKAGRLTNFNISVAVTNDFAKAVAAGRSWALRWNGETVKTVDAREMWERIVRLTYDYAEPGVLFIDRMNEQNPLRASETFAATNPCVSADTLLLTDRGQLPIGSLVGKSTTVWNGFEWSECKPYVTGHMQKLLRVTLSNGQHVDCTPTHRFILSDGSRVEASMLAEGTALAKSERPFLDPPSAEHDYRAWEQGFFSGDGHFDQRGQPWVFLYGPKRDLRDLFRSRRVSDVQGRTIVRLEQARSKAFVPDLSWDASSRLAWLAGLCDADGHAQRTDHGIAIQVTSIDRDFLIRAARMLQCLGVQPVVAMSHAAARRMMPDGTGGMAAYDCADCYRLQISAWDVATLQLHGFKPRRLDLHDNMPTRSAARFPRVVSIEALPGEHTTYCLTEPKRGTAVFNGIMTGQCGEQPLPPYGACCLGSINLAKLVLAPFTPQARLDVDRLDYLVQVGIRALDNAITISSYPLPQQREEAHNKRRIGLGVTGLADALIMLGLRYGSPEAVAATASLMRSIRYSAESATTDLGEEKGSFPLFDADRFGWFTDIRRSRRRNSHVLSIAPTGTISSFAENVSGGIEPVFDWTYTRNVLLPDGSRKKIVADDYAKSIAPEKVDATPWVTATELTPQQHIDMVAAVQPFVDSAISKTINCPADMSFEAFRDVYEYAYKSGLKGCTTYRPSGVRGAVLEKIEEKPTAKPEIVALPGTNVVAMAKPLVRDEVLNGSTYKVKPAGAEHALYVTINDVEHDGRRRPFEVFFASKDVDGYPWRVALARMISAVFRKGGDVAFIAEELKAVFDPRGGTWKDGKYIPSLIAAIGEVLEQHMRKIGMIEPDEAPITEKPRGGSATGRHCPKCQTGRLIMQEGCAHCTDCSYSKC